MAHSPISPSSAHRWLACQAAPLAEAGLPASTSRYAEEGTAAHELAASCLTHGLAASAYLGNEFNGFAVDDDMATHVQTYLDALRGYGYVDDLFHAVEAQVPFGAALGLPGETGTVDFLVLVGRELQVHDLKYGQGVEVDAVDNPQLALYALGALHEFGDLLDIETVRMVIHQPRRDHVSEWVVPVDFLRNEFGPAAAAAAENALAYLTLGQAPREAYRPDGDACRWCRAKATCPALQGLVGESLGAEVTAEDFQPVAPQPPVLPQVYSRLALVRAWCDAVEAEVRDRLMRGEPVPGYKMVAGRPGARAWTDPEAVEEILRDSMRLSRDEMYTAKLANPTTLEKVLADQPKRWARLQPFVTRGETKPVVVPETDKREAITAFEVTP